jgi:hypothetical protein
LLMKMPVVINTTIMLFHKLDGNGWSSYYSFIATQVLCFRALVG